MTSTEDPNPGRAYQRHRTNEQSCPYKESRVTRHSQINHNPNSSTRPLVGSDHKNLQFEESLHLDLNSPPAPRSSLGVSKIGFISIR